MSVNEELEEYLRSDKFRFQGASHYGATWETESGTWETIACEDGDDLRWATVVQVITRGPDGSLWGWDWQRAATEIQEHEPPDRVYPVTAEVSRVTVEKTVYRDDKGHTAIITRREV